MALFAHLEVEDRLQVNDKTRLNGSKSFESKGANAVTEITVKPGADGSAISVFNSNSEQWFLDWEFKTWDGDFDSTNNKLDFNEGAGELTATITPATYTLASLVIEVETQLNSAGTLTYTVSADDDDKITISAVGGTFSLLPTEGSNKNESILHILGFNSAGGRGDGEFSNKSSAIGKRVRYLPKAVTLNLINGVDADDPEIKYIKLYSVAGDSLWSADEDLAAKKSDILRWTEKGRNSFKKWHRKAQDEILDYLRREGHVDVFDEPLEVKDLLYPEDLRQWSTFLTLRLIMDDLSNAVDDIFDREARKFEGREMRARNDALIRADLDRDGVADLGEGVSIRSTRMIRL